MECPAAFVPESMRQTGTDFPGPSIVQCLSSTLAHLKPGTPNHRGIKSRTGPMLGFKDFDCAATTMAGIELFRRIRKGQLAMGHLLLKN